MGISTQFTSSQVSVVQTAPAVSLAPARPGRTLIVIEQVSGGPVYYGGPGVDNTTGSTILPNPIQDFEGEIWAYSPSGTAVLSIIEFY